MAPPITVRTIFPLKTAAIRQTTKGIVAKSPNGKFVFPGKITASKIVIGTSNKELDKTAGCPTERAESIPILTSRPGKCFCTKLLAAPEIGAKPSIKIETIRGMRSMTAAVLTPNCKMP
ncbi:Uncharacterised protein [Chlamydia trachomatis]|nr:Uncharacterised protein [Chlamydia trachomatis]